MVKIVLLIVLEVLLNIFDDGQRHKTQVRDDEEGLELQHKKAACRTL